MSVWEGGKRNRNVICNVQLAYCPNKALSGNASVIGYTRYQHLLSSNSAWLARLIGSVYRFSVM